jgi:hypothetical protein
VDARLARLHLRGGLLSLARAELEQMAGAGTLDREALADLAEARWRCGDLEGAAEAAEAHLAAGGEEPMAHLVAAEQADRQGRLSDARRHAAEVRQRVGEGLDRLFAGEPRGSAWPPEVPGWMDEAATEPGRWGLLAGGREVAAPEPTTWRPAAPPALVARSGPGAVARAARAVERPLPALPDPASSAAAQRELDAADAELAGGRLEPAVERLAVALRIDTTMAPVVLTMLARAGTLFGRDADIAAVHLLRGDALRGLGRDAEAEDAYRDAQRALGTRT